MVKITAPQTLYAKWDAILTSSDGYVSDPLPPMPYNPLPPSPSIFPELLIGESRGNIVVPSLITTSPPETLAISPSIVGWMTLPDGTQRVLPGNYESETGQFNFLYDDIPEGVVADSSFTMDYDLTLPAGIPENHWAYQDASRLLSQRIIDKDMITPDISMKRNELVSMLRNAVAFPLSPSGTDEPQFSDVDSDDLAILWAAEKGIVNGFPDGTFRPDAEISRQETFVIIAKFLEAYNTTPPDEGSANISPVFSDIGQVSDWALDYTDMFIQYGLVRGIPGASGPEIMPQKNITQSEMIAFISRMMDICY